MSLVFSRPGGPVGDVPQIAGGDERIENFRRIFFHRPPVDEFVTGELLDDEAVVRFVVVDVAIT